MAKWMSWLTIVGGLLLLNAPSFGGETNCGCDRPCHRPYCKSCCKCACKCGTDRAEPRAARAAPRAAPLVAPRAMIVESMPVFSMQPGIVTMPVMLASGARQLPAEEPRSRAEPNCSTSKDRLDALEVRVEALNERMMLIQRSVEIQTRILQEMKDEKIFPKRYLGEAGAENQ